VRESVKIIRAAGAAPCGVVISLDRMERGTGTQSASQEVHSQFGIPVISIATLNDLTGFLRVRPDMARQLQEVERYRKQYGVSA